MPRTLRTLLLAVGLLLLPAFLVGPAVGGHPWGSYTAATTAVVRSNGSALVDDGVLVCQPNGQGVGGACLLWSSLADAVYVFDQALGTAIAFQVCIDNDGDGLCIADGLGACSDDVYFSHSDSGAFFNPLGPLPTQFRAGCEGNGGFPGWVVLLCTGVHTAGGTHAHEALSGQVHGTFMDGTGYGDFCGGNGGGTPPPLASPFVKAYVVI